MPRQLVPLAQYVKEAQEHGEDLDLLYIDESEVVQIEREQASCTPL